MKLPGNSFARKIIRLKGWSPEEMAIEVANIDGVSVEEAQRRISGKKAEKDILKNK